MDRYAIDENFRTCIKNVLIKGNIKDKYLNSILLTDNNMVKFKEAFTQENYFADLPKYNYEVYEQLGDLTINKFIVNYIYHRYPQLCCSTCVKIVARLRINYGSVDNLSVLSENLGFLPHINAHITKDNKEKILEDVFEAFFGVVEKILDDHYTTGVGYAFCYNILENIFNELPISLEYYDLYDSKTILKELFQRDERLKEFTHVFEYNKYNSTGKIKIKKNIHNRSIGADLFSDNQEIARGTGTDKKKTEQQTCKNALIFLKSVHNIMPVIPTEYITFCNY